MVSVRTPNQKRFIKSPQFVVINRAIILIDVRIFGRQITRDVLSDAMSGKIRFGPDTSV